MISREVAITEVWLDGQARANRWQEARPRGEWWRVVLLTIALLAWASFARADSIPAGAIANELRQATPIPFAGGVGMGLAKDLLGAQVVAGYTGQLEMESLELSVDAVLKAISLYVWPGGPTLITFGGEPIVWAQANVAIDPNLTVSFGPSHLLDLGSKEIRAV